MRMSAKAMIAAGALVVGAYAQTSDAARFFLGLTEDAAPGVPAVAPGFSGTVFILADLEEGEAIPAMGISLHTDGAGFGVADAGLNNPLIAGGALGTRWNQTDVRPGSSDSSLIDELFGVKVGGGLVQGLEAFDGGVSNGIWNVGSFQLDVAPDAAGSLWLSAGPRGLPVQGSAPNQGDLVGFGDDEAPNNLVGASGNPDLVVPEPASMALIGLGALAMLRRRSA